MTPGDPEHDGRPLEPNEHERQLQARRVWQNVLLLWVVVAIVALAAAGGLAAIGYRVGGIPGLLLPVVFVVAFLVYGGKRLMEY